MGSEWKDSDAAYAAMASDSEHEGEALEWAEETVGDIAALCEAGVESDDSRSSTRDQSDKRRQ